MLRYDDNIRKWIDDEHDEKHNSVMSCAAACMYIAAGIAMVCAVGFAIVILEAIS